VAIKQVAYSDISGDIVPEEEHTRVVVLLPDAPYPVELDASAEEAMTFVSTTLRLAEVTVYEQNQPPKRLQIETKNLDRLFPSVKNFEELLATARRADAPQAAPRRGRPASPLKTLKAASGDKLDYTAMENIALVHRGRVTEEEAKLVRDNMDVANANRARAGQPPVGQDPKDAQRYSL
jgi:hypothetical protein